MKFSQDMILYAYLSIVLVYGTREQFLNLNMRELFSQYHSDIHLHYITALLLYYFAALVKMIQ